MVLLWSDQALDQAALTSAQVEILQRDFPFVQVITKPIEEELPQEQSNSSNQPNQLNQPNQSSQPNFYQDVEIVHASALSIQQIDAFPRLRWIHCPLVSLQGFPLPLLVQKRKDILLTHVMSKPSTHYLDFAMALLFGCAQGVIDGVLDRVLDGEKEKNIKNAKPFSRTLLVQIGLGACGTVLAKRAKEAHMRVIGISLNASFHPYCDKVLRYDQLHSVLSAADVVVMTAGRSGEKSIPLGREEFKLMKPSSSLFVLGSNHTIDYSALFTALQHAELRQVWVDCPWPDEAPQQKWNWKQFPKFLYTPGLIDSMVHDMPADFFFFWNLDCFVHRRYLEMQGLWDRTPARLLERRRGRIL